MGRDRAFRRHHLRRIKEKARFIKRQIWGMFQNIFVRYAEEPPPPIPPGEEDPRVIGLGASTHCKPCSCAGCGNPRRHWSGDYGGLTRQERLAKLSEREQLEELEEGQDD